MALEIARAVQTPLPLLDISSPSRSKLCKSLLHQFNLCNSHDYSIQIAVVYGYQFTHTGATNKDASPNSMVPTFANPIWIEITVLAKCSMKNSRRMPELFRIWLGSVVVIGFILATMFWNKASKIPFAPKVYPYENLRVELGGEP